MLSGVVVKFDKLNPHLSRIGEVPLVGDLMTSRWAFEAAMVTQFRDNAYENMFYTYEKIMANADYKKIYYFPTLESKLAYNLNNFDSQDPAVIDNREKNLRILRTEIANELKIVGQDKFPGLDRLTPERFDSTVYRQAYDFLKKSRYFYSNRYNKADKAREAMVIKLTDTEEKKKEFDRLKARYRNETIAEIVTNRNEPDRIVEKGDHLVQVIFPIYKDPQPDHLLDYRDQFYVPKKHLLGYEFDTLIFNLTVIWLMSIFLSLALYFDLLRKAVNLLERK